MNWLWSGVLALAAASVLLFAQPLQAQQQPCDPSYRTVCIASAPPDLDCADVAATHFEVRQPDLHGFDRDKDGIGCES